MTGKTGQLISCGPGTWRARFPRPRAGTACFGTKRTPVQIRPPRLNYFCCRVIQHCLYPGELLACEHKDGLSRALLTALTWAAGSSLQIRR